MGRRRGGWESEGWGGRPLVTILLDSVPRVSRQESLSPICTYFLAYLNPCYVTLLWPNMVLHGLI